MSQKVEVDLDLAGEGWMAVSYKNTDGDTFYGMLMRQAKRVDAPSLLKPTEVDRWKEALGKERDFNDDMNTSNDNDTSDDSNSGEKTSALSDRTTAVSHARPVRSHRLRPSSRLLCSKCKSAVSSVTDQASKRKSDLNNFPYNAAKRVKMVSKPSMLSPVPKLILPKPRTSSAPFIFAPKSSATVTSIANRYTTQTAMSGNVAPKATALVRQTGTGPKLLIRRPIVNRVIHQRPSLLTNHHLIKPTPAIAPKPTPSLAPVPKLRICYKADGRAVIVRTTEMPVVSNTQSKPVTATATANATIKTFEPVKLQIPGPRPSILKPLIKKTGLPTLIQKPKPVVLAPAPPTSSSPPPEDQNPLGLTPGDICWAKMKGEPYWPAEIYSFNPGAEACVLWLGSKLHGFLQIRTLERFPANFAKRYNPKRNSKGYQTAVVNAILKCQARGIDDDSYYKKKLSKQAWKKFGLPPPKPEKKGKAKPKVKKYRQAPQPEVKPLEEAEKLPEKLETPPEEALEESASCSSTETELLNLERSLEVDSPSPGRLAIECVESDDEVESLPSDRPESSPGDRSTRTGGDSLDSVIRELKEMAYLSNMQDNKTVQARC